MTICQHHLYMASSEALTGRPRGGEMVKVGGAARARPKTAIENRRRQCCRQGPSLQHCRRGFLIFVPGKRPAGPPKYIFHEAKGPFTCHENVTSCRRLASCRITWPLRCRTASHACSRLHGCAAAARRARGAYGALWWRACGAQPKTWAVTTCHGMTHHVTNMSRTCHKHVTCP